MKVFYDVLLKGEEGKLQDKEIEIGSDGYPLEEVDGIIYKIKGTAIKESNDIDESAIGGNKSAEAQEEDEGVDSSVTQGINVVLTHKLQELPMDKKGYMAHIKDYMKRLTKKAKEDGMSDDDLKEVQKGLQKFVKEQVIDQFKEWQFYGNEEYEDGMIILCKYEEQDPFFYYFKHGLREEKC